MQNIQKEDGSGQVHNKSTTCLDLRPLGLFVDGGFLLNRCINNR